MLPCLVTCKTVMYYRAQNRMEGKGIMIEMKAVDMKVVKLCIVLQCLISFKKDVDMLLWYHRVWRNLPLFFK